MPDSPYSILFEPVRIGPVTARNRFYQVPHCTGLGYRYPRSEARLRGIKAEGGWGVVSTQETEIHPSSDMTPYNEGRLWSDEDIPALQLMTEAVHEHGSLAAIQLVHNGLHTANNYTRATPLAPMHVPLDTYDPVQARAMSKRDIAEFRHWHIQAALRARQAGFDIVYAYAGHGMSLLHHFLLLRHNQRSDEYGGSFENRLRLFREVITDTQDAVGESCAIAVRLAVDELLGASGMQHDGEARDIIEALAELPDLWDVNLSDWANDSQSARFSEEGFQEQYTAFVKAVTSKPVVGVGRYTSPDAMARVIRNGLLDFIGAARPSIADPFLPEKIANARLEDIRECIGCNICTASDNTCSPIRCTQNPTMGEEWRRDWHPEYIPQLTTRERCLIVGGGPAGLEAARALAQRGAEVTIAEATTQWGGRTTLESRLPGMAAIARVRDHRLSQLQRMSNVQMFLDNKLSADDILHMDYDHVAIATGAQWRSDCIGRTHRLPLDYLDHERIVSPEDLLHSGRDAIKEKGPVVIYDDDHYYLGGVLAELCVQSGFETTLVTPAAIVSSWSDYTLEQEQIQASLIHKGVNIIALHQLAGMLPETLALTCIYSDKSQSIDCTSLVPVTARLPNETLWHAMTAQRDEWKDGGILSVQRIGDCNAPSLIASAIQAGHLYARNLGLAAPVSPKREDFIPLYQ
ncbi:MAG: FAD-dependent oxidoreductase [Granulosicoccus sp.]